MALTPQEMQELAELEELEALEAEEAQHASRGPAVAPREPVSKAKSAAAGVSQGLTMGYTPQIVGGLSTLLGKAQDLIQGPVINPATGEAIPRVDYTTARDSTVKEIDQAANDNPLTYMGGTIAGSLPAAKGMGAVSSAPATVGKRLAAAAGTGAAQGALYNPGDEEGVVDPLQAGKRGTNAALSALLGFAGQGLGEGARKGAEVVRNVKDLKTGAMADRAVSALDDAAGKIDETQLSPRREKLESLIKGRSYEVNPDRVEPVFPQLANKMAEKAAPSSNPMLGVAGEAPGPARTSLSGSRALKLKRGADSAAGYGASKPFDSAATAKGEEAKSLADILRRQFNADADVATLNQESSEIIALKDALLKREGTAPIETLKAPIGSSRHAVLSKVDEMVGTDLRGLGETIGNTADLIIEPSRLVKPLEMPDELRKIGIRAASRAGSELNKAPQGTKESLSSALLETKRRAK